MKDKKGKKIFLKHCGLNAVSEISGAIPCNFWYHFSMKNKEQKVVKSGFQAIHLSGNEVFL